MGTKPHGAIEADDGALRIDTDGIHVVFQVPLISRPANKRSFNIRFQTYQANSSPVHFSVPGDMINHGLSNINGNWVNTSTLHTDQSKDTIDNTGLVEDYGNLNKEDLCSQEIKIFMQSMTNVGYAMSVWISGEKDSNLTPNQQYTYVHTYHVTDRRPASSYLIKKGLAENLNTLIQENKTCMSFPL